MRKFFYLIITVIGFCFYFQYSLSARYNLDISSWLKNKYDDFLVKQEFKDLFQGKNFSDLYKKFYTNLSVRNFTSFKYGLEYLKLILSKKGCSINNEDIYSILYSMMLNGYNVKKYVDLLKKGKKEFPINRVVNSCRKILNCFSVSIYDKKINNKKILDGLTLAKCYDWVYFYLLMGQTNYSIYNDMLDFNLGNDLLINGDESDGPFDLLVDIYELRRILFKTQNVKKPKKIKFYNEADLNFLLGGNEKKLKNNGGDIKVDKKNISEKGNFSNNGKEGGYSYINNEGNNNTNASFLSYGKVSSNDSYVNGVNNNNDENEIIINNSSCINNSNNKEVNAILNSDLEKGGESVSEYGNEGYGNNILGEGNLSGGKKNEVSKLQDINSSFTGIISSLKEKFFNNSKKNNNSVGNNSINSDSNRTLCAGTDPNKIVGVRICLIPSSVSFSEGGRVYSIEDIIDKFIGIFGKLKNSGQVMKFAYTREFWDLGLRHIDLSKVFVFDIVIIKKPLFQNIFSKNDEDKKKKEKDVEKKYLEDRERQIGIFFSDNLDDRLERNKYVVLGQGKYYFGYLDRSYNNILVPYIEQMSLANNILDTFYQFFKYNLNDWQEVVNILLQVKRWSKYLYSETDK